nr:MAG TPA: hypothetical protein [Caudoviricetes sp.]
MRESSLPPGGSQLARCHRAQAPKPHKEGTP